MGDFRRLRRVGEYSHLIFLSSVWLRDAGARRGEIQATWASSLVSDVPQALPVIVTLTSDRPFRTGKLIIVSRPLSSQSFRYCDIAETTPIPPSNDKCTFPISTCLYDGLTVSAKHPNYVYAPRVCRHLILLVPVLQELYVL